MKAPSTKSNDDKTISAPLCAPHTVPRDQLTDEENSRYYEEYKKLLFTAFCIDKQRFEFRQRKHNLEGKLIALEKSFLGAGHEEHPQESQSSDAHKPKRYRRTNDMIQRNYRCPYEKCDKAYASDGSLQQHIRLKHETKNSDKQSSQDNIEEER